MSAVLRGRPRARPTNRAPSPIFNTSTPSHIPHHLYPPSVSAAIATSLDSGLNQFHNTSRVTSASSGSVTKTRPITKDLEQQQHIIHRQQQRSRNSDIKCKSVYFDLDESSPTPPLDQFGQPYFTPQKPSVTHSNSIARDEFGLTPFLSSQERHHTPITGGPNHFPDSGMIDEFGAPHFTSRSTSQQSNVSSDSRSTPDLFGARPFVQSTDAFGATPFVTT